MKNKNSKFEDLEVYKKLCSLHLKVSELTFKFPEFELHEIGSELRRLSNAAPASIAEGYSNKHVKFYIERIHRSLGEVRQTIHYLNIAFKKKYIERDNHTDIISQYDECVRMLKALEKSLHSMKSRQNTFTKNQYPGSFYP